jgi:hypothetical protein
MPGLDLVVPNFQTPPALSQAMRMVGNAVAPAPATAIPGFIPGGLFAPIAGYFRAWLAAGFRRVVLIELVDHGFTQLNIPTEHHAGHA